MAALKAKNMEIEVQDYISWNPTEGGSSGSSCEGKAGVPNQEHKGEGSCSPLQMGYA